MEKAILQMYVHMVFMLEPMADKLGLHQSSAQAVDNPLG